MTIVKMPWMWSRQTQWLASGALGSFVASLTMLSVLPAALLLFVLGLVLGWVGLTNYIGEKAKRNNARLYGIYFIIVMGILTAERFKADIIYLCPTVSEAKQTLAINREIQGNHGRKKAIECLAIRERSMRCPVLQTAENEDLSIRGEILIGATLDDLRAPRARLENVRFQGAKLNRAMFSCARLDGAFFHHGAELVGADFRGAYLGSATLGARGSGVKPDIRGVKFDRRTNLYETWLHGLTPDDLPCEVLRQAKNWKTAYRDEVLACGSSPTPKHPDWLKIHGTR